MNIPDFWDREARSRILEIKGVTRKLLTPEDASKVEEWVNLIALCPRLDETPCCGKCHIGDKLEAAVADLEAEGWVTGTVEEFLGLTEEEKREVEKRMKDRDQ